MKRAFAVAMIAALLGGCANLTHFNAMRSVPDGQVGYVDAKQRAIVFDDYGHVCAEPSPDALSALAASNSLNLSTGGGTEAGASGSVAETAGLIGLRTQAITLMRDHMYRLCEGHLTGAIPDQTFQLMHRRMQLTMVGILAIEQLTGAVRAPAVVLSSNASTGNTEAVVTLTEKREELRGQIAALNTQIEEHQSNIEGLDAEIEAGAPEEGQEESPEIAQKRTERGTAQGELTEAQARREELQAEYEAVGTSLAQVGSATSAGASGALENLRFQPGDVEKLAEAVQAITLETFRLTANDSIDMCSVIFLSQLEEGQEALKENPAYLTCVKDLELQLDFARRYQEERLAQETRKIQGKEEANASKSSSL